MIPSFVNSLWKASQPTDVEMALRDPTNSRLPAPLHPLQDQPIDSHAVAPEPPVNGSIPPPLHETTPFDRSSAIKIHFSNKRLKPISPAQSNRRRGRSQTPPSKDTDKAQDVSG